MALDGILIRTINKELQTLIPAKINKIAQVSDDEVLLTIRANRNNLKLLISTHSSYNRINITSANYKSPDTPNNFIMVLRKYIEGAIILDIKQVGLDRIIDMSLQIRDELHDYHNYHLYIELMGKYANIVLVNDEERIVDALKRIPPYENSTRTIHPGAKYILPKPHEFKQNPFEISEVDKDNSLVKQLHGFSPLLSDEVLYRLNHNETFKDIMNEIDNSKDLYIYKNNLFHLIELKHLNIPYTKLPINEGLDHLYSAEEEQVRIKQQSGDIAKVIKQELKKNRNKLIKLESTLDAALDLDKYTKYGDLLYAYAYMFKHNESSVTLKDFETNEDVVIPLNNKISIKQNAKKYYQKYTKSKTAQIEVSKQIEITKNTIRYFENLETQLASANVSDAIEMKEELINNGYLRKRIKNNRKKKNNKPNFITLNIDETYIYVGKNNIQNDYITFKQAHRSDTWMHVKDMHGSHVVISEENPSEEILRIAANFAAYYSQGKESSSVPVNYCLIKQLKKPNKAAMGFVTLSNYKTIYIDPNEKEINEILSKYQKK